MTSLMGARPGRPAAPGSVAAAAGAARTLRRWLAGFAALLLAPLLVRLAIGGPAWAQLVDLTGLFALSALVGTFVLVSRLRMLSRAAGITTLIGAHRALGVFSAASVLAHVAVVVAADRRNLVLLGWVDAPPRARAAVGATLALAGVVALGVYRSRLRDYELWRWAHALLAVAAVVLSALHVWLIGGLVQHPVMRWVLAGMAVALVAALLNRWYGAGSRSSEHVVREVRPESDTVCTVVLDPVGRPLRFAPGQFAWLRLARRGEEHPFTIASSAAGPGVSFTVRSTGDFGTALRGLPPGAPVWIDGPYGSCSVDLLPQPGAGAVMVAAGVGITPMMSMLRTLADRRDRRPLLLVRAAGEPGELFFRAELAQLSGRLDLTVLEVVRRPPPDWPGAAGSVDAPLLAAVLPPPAHRAGVDYFVCGSPGFVDGVVGSLAELGVPEHRVHTEQF
ncbi:hypothetical protein BJF78_06305 [Pseudonocardia sp. CNS-139]|nr:hypothetical protein BJF78_06305 [Pseudonocardia sp. CNS-139]